MCVGFFLVHQAQANMQGILCADVKHSPAYNTSDSPANNVPARECYLKPITNKCVFHNGPHSLGAIDEPCPDFVAGKDCCRWGSSPVGGGGGSGGSGGAGGSGGGIGIGGGLGINPCIAKGLVLVTGNPFNMSLGAKDSLCCASRTPKEDLLSGKRVCCEVVKPLQ
jgi:hypothetical protein